MKRASIAFFVLTVSVLACKTGDAAARERVFNDLYPSPTAVREATQIVRVITTTPLPTYTPRVVVYTSTPVPPSETKPVKTSWLCVSASEAVYLRPSPNVLNYPIMELDNGTKVKSEGGEDGGWLFVSVGDKRDKRGWVNQKYLSACK